MPEYNVIFILVIVIISVCAPSFRRNHRNIYLRPNKFWELVGSQDRPVVLLTTKGLALRTHCYVFPYQGILFHTDLGQTESDRPKEVMIIKTGKDYNLG